MKRIVKTSLSILCCVAAMTAMPSCAEKPTDGTETSFESVITELHCKSQNKDIVKVYVIQCPDLVKYNPQVVNLCEDCHFFCSPPFAQAFVTSSTKIKAIGSITFLNEVFSIWDHCLVCQ